MKALTVEDQLAQTTEARMESRTKDRTLVQGRMTIHQAVAVQLPQVVIIPVARVGAPQLPMAKTLPQAVTAQLPQVATIPAARVAALLLLMVISQAQPAQQLLVAMVPVTHPIPLHRKRVRRQSIVIIRNYSV